MTVTHNDFPKTLIVDLSMFYGGSTSRVLSLIARLPSDKVAIATLASSAVTEQARRLHLPVHIIGKNKIDYHILSNLRRLIYNENFQILDTQNIQSKFWASMVTQYTKTALVSTIHSWYANSEQGKTYIKGRLYTALEFATNRHLMHYITVSQKDYRSLCNSGISEKDISLIYNAVDIQPDNISGDSRWLRKKYDIPSDSIVCLAVGRLVQVKGYDVLVDAIRLMCQDVPNLYCLVIGDGPLKEDLLRQIQNAGLQTRVHLIGYLERSTVLETLKSSDIFVMPSRYEGTPIALLEAAALGISILASNTGGIPELVQNEEHALLIPPDNPTALADGLTRLSKNREFSRFLGKNAQDHVQQHFSLDRQVKDTIHVYKKAWRKFQDEQYNYPTQR